MRNTMPVIDNPNFSNFLAPGARRLVSNNSGCAERLIFNYFRRYGGSFLDLCSDIEKSSIVTMLVPEFNRAAVEFSLTNSVVEERRTVDDWSFSYSHTVVSIGEREENESLRGSSIGKCSNAISRSILNRLRVFYYDFAVVRFPYAEWIVIKPTNATKRRFELRNNTFSSLDEAGFFSHAPVRTKFHLATSQHN